MNGLLPPEIAMVVGPEERVLWTGHAGRVGPGAEGCFGGCFGLFFAGFAIFWMAGASWMAFGVNSVPQANGAARGVFAFPLFGIPFILVGLYVIVTSVYWGPKRKSSGLYAVTDRRLLFLRTFPKLVVKEIPLSRNVRMEQNLNHDGSGTLAFVDPISVADPEGLTVRRRQYGGASVYRSENTYTFHNISDAAQTAHLIRGLIER